MRIVILIFLLISLSSNAQITINAGGSAASIVNTLVTNGITVTNPTINCSSTAYGTYTGNLQAGGAQLSNGGILLTTGSATAADGPNTSTATSNIVTGYDFSDPNLTTQPGAGSPPPAKDNCVLEFDMKPSCSQFNVSYVFGSDEYPEFVSSSYNDGFGIFITGPNPAGGTYNAYNMARLPNGQLVSIDNVNTNTNATYYNTNTNNVTSYDGYTDGLTGQLSVVPCSTYHVKIIIADAGDESFDSGLFLGAGSFACSAPALTLAASPTTICNGQSSTLTATPSLTGGTYSWTSSPAGFTGSTQSVTVNPTVTTTYTCNYTLNGCAAVSSTVTVTVTPSNTPTFTQVGPYCSGATIPALPTTSNNGVTGTWSPTLNNTATTTYTFTPTAGLCATTQTMTITINPNTTPTFTQVGPYCSGATIPSLPTTSNNGITGTWSPALNNTATTTYTFTPTAGLCATTQTMTITINPNTTPTFTQLGPFCSGATISSLPTTSNNGITGTWSPAINNTSTTTYTFTPTVGLCATTTTMTININSNTTPTFTQVGPYCAGATIPTLPTTSNNGITGTWSPAIDNTATTNYTFTPSAGQCATTQTMTIAINPNTTPSFTQVGPFCSGASITALPTTSNNSITGTWSPAINNTTTTTYTFTPTAGLCATTTNMTININSNTTPTFSLVGPYCSGASIPALPTTSNEGINGSWSPAIDNITTTTYTFTPISGQCGLTATMTITITPNTTPTFSQVGPYCSGSAIGALPTSSNEGVTGTWSPAIDNSTTTTYTFTPSTNQCALNQTMTISINSQTLPTFSQLGAYCQNDIPGTLSNTSNNSITGTWNPTTISTSTAGSTIYTFTPDTGQCATANTMTIVVNALVTPTFNQLGAYCQNATPGTLPISSTNSISGTWNPATISTSNTGSATYTFTPSVGQCAIQTTMTVAVNAPGLVPTFNQVGPYCQNSNPGALPTTSSNSVTGTWSPATISTATAGNSTYTFNVNPNQCAVNTTMSITINPTITPTFTQLGSYCQNSTPGTLPATSINSVNGTWSPASINTATAGTITYTFTPNGSTCATQQTMSIVTDPQITPTFSTIGPLCLNSTAPILNSASTNGINGTWSPTSINTSTLGNTIYTFTPSAGQCATNTTLNVNILTPTTPTFTQLGPFCQNTTAVSLPSNSTNNPGITGTWNPAVINTASGGSSTYTFTPATSECAVQTTMSISVIPVTPPTFSADITSGCSPLNVVLTTQNIPGATYTWTSNNGNIGNGASIQASFSSAGCYDISLSISANGCSTSSTLADYICVENSPIAAFMSNPFIFTNTNENVNFTNNSVGASSYTWEFGDGAVSTQTNPTHNYSNITGNYLVTLTASSSLGCFDIATMVLSYQETTVFYVPNSFTPDQDEFNQTWGPVFTSGFDPYNFDLYVFDRWGEIIWESHDANARWDGTYGANGNKVQDGIYTYRINYKPKETDKKYHISGHITLIR